MNFLHSGNVGDVIYSLPTVRAFGGGNLYLRPNDPALYTFPHPWGNVKLTVQACEMLAPLLRVQPYLSDSQVFSGQTIDINLDLFRDAEIDFTSGHIAMMYLHTFPKVHADLSQRWLIADPSDDYRGCIVVTRTSRYHNQRFKIGRAHV